MTFGKFVEGFLFPVEVSESEEKGDTSEGGQTGIFPRKKGQSRPGERQQSKYLHCAQHIVPNEVRVVGQGHESFTDGGSDGVGKQSDGLHNRSHVSRGLRVGVFQDGNGRKDLLGAVSGRLI
jgi:hypothetical protein